MAVAHDAVSESHTGTTGVSGVTSFTWNHAPTGSPRSALVFTYAVGANPVTSVTYGTVSMNAVPYTAYDSDTEPGFVQAWFLDNCGTGTKAVVVNRTSNAVVTYAVCMTQTAASACEVYTAGVKTRSGSGAEQTAASSSNTGTATSWASMSVTDGSPGTNSVRYLAVHNGSSSVSAASTNTTSLGTNASIDFGLYTFATYRDTTPSQGAVTLTIATAISDDLAVIGLAVRETPSANVLVQPGAAAVTIGTATPTVVGQNYILLTPSAAAVTVAGATPTVAIVANVSVQPAAAAVTIATATPAIVAQNWPRIQPAAAAITVAGATPALVAQNWPKIQPAAAAITIGTATPAVGTPVTVQPTAAAITVAGATPAVVGQNWPRISPAAAAVTVTTATPALVAQNWPKAAPAAAAITIAGATPAVSAGASITIQPGAAAITITGATPTVVAQNYILRQPAAAAMAMAGATPTVTVGRNVYVTPGPLGLTITGAVPLITGGMVLEDRPSGGHGRRRPSPPRSIDVLADDDDVLLMLYA